MRRRTILGLATALLAAPAKLLAQSQRVYRVGAFQFGETPVLRDHMRVFRERLQQLGFAAGRNLQMVEEYSSIDPVARAQSADKLIRAKPDVILSFGSTNTRSIQAASTNKLPVVFTIVGDPVAYGVVKELARPGGNTTGVAFLQREMTVKRLELLREVLPKARRVVVAAYQQDVTYTASEPLVRQIAARLGFELVTAELSGPTPDAAVSKAIEGGADAIFVYQPMSFVVGLEAPEKIVRLATGRRIPVFFAEPDLVVRGGLLSYGPNFLDETRRAADLVAKVLRGANAGDLPVEQSARFELVVNLKAAKALGIAIPESVRPRIDRVVE
ncbi:MAG TPA: ABC transporter substrate-binding protein [Burkholderiales bacterium]|jgi:putative ABC transport system substrate-binding protein